MRAAPLLLLLIPLAIPACRHRDPRDERDIEFVGKMVTAYENGEMPDYVQYEIRCYCCRRRDGRPLPEELQAACRRAEPLLARNIDCDLLQRGVDDYGRTLLPNGKMRPLPDLE